MRKLTILLIMLSLNALSQENIGFQTPPEEILQLVDINPQPAVRIDSDNRYLVILERRAFKDLEELAADEVRLAGLRINPQTHSPSRQGYFYGISISDLHRGKEIPIKGLPENPRLSDVMFSPDGNKLSFLQTQGTETQLWVIDLIQGSAVMMYRQKLNGCMGTPYFWGPDSETLFLKVIPQDREDTPGRKPLPSGPSIQVATGKKAPVKTFQDMLRTPYDEYLFEFYTRSTILQLKLDGSLTPFLPPAIYYSLSFSPDGKYLFIETLEKPFSYRVPFYRFPMRYSLHSETGEFLRTFYERPSTEDVLPGFDACEKGRREISWRNDHPATLVWAEALDGGDPAFQTDERDAIYQQEVAGESEPKKLTVTRYRFSGIVWGKEDLALLYEYWYKTRKTVTSIINPARPEVGKQVIFELSSEDLYADPGSFLTHRNAFNRQVLWITGNAKKLYLEGEGYSPEGNKPFLDEYILTSGKTKRLWQADGISTYESILRIIDPEKRQMITSVEGKFTNPNLYLRTGNQLKALTEFPNPYADFGKTVKSEKIYYQRTDGVELTGTLYLPASFDVSRGQTLPLLIWAYPREYKDADQAGQISDSPHRFVRLNYGSPVFWVKRGFAVLDDASFPIVGEGESEPNDTFIPQLVDNAASAIRYTSEKGICDPDRVAIGGHSYGAFMVANLLANSDLFAAGIARSGAYNRTLTPFGFQSEERTFWEAPEVYLKMSPFVSADHIKAPLLLIHGDADNNPGTFTLQSERLFAALNGLGVTSRLVLLPYESHGYAARENILHMLWETDQWLMTYVKEKKRK